MQWFMMPSRHKGMLVVLLTVLQIFPAAAFAQSPIKIQQAHGEVDFATAGLPSFVMEGTASHLGQFTAHGEVELLPGEAAGMLVGEGLVVFEAANGDLLAGVMTWDLNEADQQGHIHFSWRDFVEFSDGTIVSSTGRFVDNRPPGALVALEFLFVATILVLGIIAPRF